MAMHGHGTALIFARTDTSMFQDLVFPYADALLFVRGRIKFLTPDGIETKDAGAPSVLVAYGAADADQLKRSGIAAAIHQEGFDVAEGTFEYPGGWTLRYATIGDNTKAFWWYMLGEVVPFVRKRMGFIAAAWMIRREGEAIRVVMSVFISRHGVEGVGIAAGRVRDVASGLSSAVSTDLVSYRAAAVVEPTFNAREFRRVTSWDSRR